MTRWNSDFLKGGLLVGLALFLMAAYSPGSVVQTDSGSVSGGQSNIALVLNLPYSFDGTNWTRAGCTVSKIISGASTNATSVKASAGVLYGLYVINNNATATNFRYLKFYNKASAPTVGTDTVVIPYGLPGTGGGQQTIPPTGIPFTTGIAYATTTGAADSDTGAVAANEIVGYLCYK